MTIKIIQTVQRIAMKDISDIRSFIEGEIHELSPANEEHLLKLGIAEPAVVVQTPVAPISDITAAPVAEPAPEAASEAPAPAAEHAIQPDTPAPAAPAEPAAVS